MDKRKDLVVMIREPIWQQQITQGPFSFLQSLGWIYG